MTPKQVPLGTLSIGAKIGEGGYGVVHEARIENLRHRFAIKFLDPSSFADSSNAIRRFYREAEIMLTLTHKNICRIFGVGEHEGRPYILMERVPAVSLEKAAEKRGLAPPDVCIKILRGFASGLSYAHQNNIVHRDVSPRNLIASTQGEWVLDFGIAAIADPKGTRITKTGRPVMGDSFASPEMIENPDIADPRNDIYSLGAVWYWLLTGQSPRGRNAERALKEKLELPEEYERVLLRTIDSADKRYQSADALIADLDLLAAGEAVESSEDELSKNEKIVLGIIADETLTDDSSCEVFRLKQAIGKRMQRLTVGVALRRLRRLALVKDNVVYDQDGDAFNAVHLSEEGKEWVEENHGELTELIVDPWSGDLPF